MLYHIITSDRITTDGTAAYVLPDGDALLIEAGVQVASENLFQGTITGAGKASITVFGTVKSKDGQAITAEDLTLNVEKVGTLSTDQATDVINATGNLNVYNKGLIAGNNPDGRYAMLTSGQLNLVNEGVIRGGINAACDNQLYAWDKIINNGTIEGVIGLGKAADYYNGSMGKLIGVLYLGSGNDTAYGGAGAEVIYGDEDHDYIVGGGGADMLFGGSGNDSIFGGSVADRLYGETGQDALIGAAGNDLLDGGADADIMTGGEGNDTYFVDHMGDRVTELKDGGAGDTIFTSISYTLGSYVERMLATGVDALNLAGNSLNNTIDGNDGSNRITGAGGNDRLNGSFGNDVLYGGSGSDRFVFNSAPSSTTNKDIIKDWSAKDDTILLENAVFTALKKTGVLSKSYFVLGSKAKDSNDFVGYNKNTGDLWYDANGSKAGGQVSFASIGKNKIIDYHDFQII